MPTPSEPLREHFADVMPPTPQFRDSAYKPLRCMFCVSAHERLGLAKPAVISSRAHKLREHISKCPHAASILIPGEKLLSGVLSDDLGSKLPTLLLQAIADANIAPTIVEKPSFIAFVEALCPGAKTFLPSRRQLGGLVLKNEAIKCEQQQRKTWKQRQVVTGGKVSFLSDAWQNISKRHVLGCQLSLFGTSVTLPLEETGSRHDGVAIAHQLEEVIIACEKEGWNIGSCVTDGAGQCNRARAILSARRPDMVFVQCHAHDINNLVRQVLNNAFKSVTEAASKEVNYINQSSSKWLKEAHAIIRGRYGSECQFCTLCATRWSSTQECFASLLAVEGGLRSLHEVHGKSKEFPPALASFGDGNFWWELVKAERVIRPLAKASFRLQRDMNTLADVVISLRDIYCTFATSGERSAALVACVEGRWKKFEQPLYILAFCLHPRFRVQSRRLRHSIISSKAVADAAVYYHRRLLGEDGIGPLRDEVRAWFNGDGPTSQPSEYENYTVGYWLDAHDDGYFPVLSKLAIVVLSVAVNTASCERRFSELGAIHSRDRDSMEAKKSREYHLVRKRGWEAQGEAGKPKKRLRIRKVSERPVVFSSASATPSTATGDEIEVHDDGPEEDRILCAFDFWERTLDVILDETELAEGYEEQHAERPPIRDPYDAIKGLRLGPYPDPGGMTETGGMYHKVHLKGFRGLKVPLASLFSIEADLDDDSDEDSE